MTQSDIFEVIRKNVLDVMFALDEKDVTPSSSLRELGANSLDRATIITQALSDLKLRMPLVHAAGASDLGELAALMLRYRERA